MHNSAMEWVSSCLGKPQRDVGNNVLEIGSLDINGSIRGLFNTLISDGGLYFGIDLQAGPGVDFVADAARFKSDIGYDIVVCCEVFEHSSAWKEIVNNAHRLLCAGGLFIATMAGDGRPPHSAIDENPIRSWEYYKNVGQTEMDAALSAFSEREVNMLDTDTRCWAIK